MSSKLMSHFRIIYLLPVIHLLACIAITVARVPGWGVMFIVDLPFSIVIAPLPWYNIPLPWAFGTLGTLWWYALSVLIMKLQLREKGKHQTEKATADGGVAGSADSGK